ncbi:gp11 baseplate wedge subunit and tail pin [Escherichia phage JS10]|uniref:Gp11 baseplate wedge subunit and tail pin n=1 Tax=Escherichia phage JS10 TaxID=576790 RepID=C4MZP9_9CAUD|nr:baseplate wedge subunit [Escherichia phage JS10]ACL78380.1 gp11 baseplate wedge subunit and tail pin [Escherichia phage JS10]
MTLTEMKSGLKSRLADYLELSYTSDKPTAVADQRPIGGPSANQTQKGVYFPTVQSAIDDIAFRTELPVNSVIITTENRAPGFIQQSDKITFTGSISSGGELGDPVIIKVFGLPVEVLVGDSSVLVASKVNDVFLDAIANSYILAETSIDALDQSTLNIKYNDYQNHIFSPYKQSGCTISHTIVQQPRAGYGKWEYLGNSTQSLAGGTVNGTIPLYYYKRLY